jgi:hypothetical protein
MFPFCCFTAEDKIAVHIEYWAVWNPEPFWEWSEDKRLFGSEARKRGCLEVKRGQDAVWK